MLLASSIRGRPGLGRSASPSRRSATKRARHFPTVVSDTPRRRATCALSAPEAHASTIRARGATRLRRVPRAHFSSVARSASVKTSSAFGRPTAKAYRVIQWIKDSAFPTGLPADRGIIAVPTPFGQWARRGLVHPARPNRELPAVVSPPGLLFSDQAGLRVADRPPGGIPARVPNELKTQPCLPSDVKKLTPTRSDLTCALPTEPSAWMLRRRVRSRGVTRSEVASGNCFDEVTRSGYFGLVVFREPSTWQGPRGFSGREGSRKASTQWPGLAPISALVAPFPLSG